MNKFKKKKNSVALSFIKNFDFEKNHIFGITFTKTSITFEIQNIFKNAEIRKIVFQGSSHLCKPQFRVRLHVKLQTCSILLQHLSEQVCLPQDFFL